MRLLAGTVRPLLAIFVLNVASVPMYSYRACAAHVHATAPASSLQSGIDITGSWSGAIDLPGVKLEFDVDISHGETGWSGDISIPAQNLRDLPLAGVSLTERTLTFGIPGIPGDPTFRADLAADAVSFSGTFTQGGASFPFSMTRTRGVEAVAAENIEGFAEWVEATRAAWKVPGCSVAIVWKDQVVFAAGFGRRDLEQDLPVTADTLFAIGSSTKAFTTFGIGLLADEGRLNWEQPVRTWMPEFALEDELAAQRMTAVDLVTHRSGLPRHDLLWYNSSLSREDLYRHLPHLASNKDFRTDFQYNNLMFLTAGILVERVTGSTWEDFVEQRIFQPLGMNRSNFSVRTSQADLDHALPYQEKDDVVKVMPFRDISNVGPAGSINSSAQELSQWLRVHLAHGKLGESQIISAGTLDRIHRPAMVMGGFNPQEPEVISTGYALGWFTEAYRGHQRVQHGGNIDGFSALVSLMPADQLGVVVLTNLNGSGLPEVIARHAADRFLDLEPIDWSTRWLAQVAQAKELQKQAEAKREVNRIQGTTHSRALTDYVADYENAGYGTVAVTMDSGRLSVTYNGLRAPMEHWHYDVFSCLENPVDPTLKDTKVQFRSDVDGDVTELVVTFEVSVSPIVFTRKADAVLRDPAYLARLAGAYELMSQHITIEVRGAALFASIAGQPDYELEPLINNTFRLKGLEGFKVRFLTDAEGEFKVARFIQPNGIFDAARVTSN